MSERNFLVVSNSLSGTGKSQYALGKLKKRLDKEGLKYTVFLTTASKNLFEFIEDNLAENTSDVVVIGGDGTINAAVNAIFDKRIVLSVIPTGSGNDFVKTVPLGNNLEQQIETIISGKQIRADIGDCNGRKFINGVGLGFDGQIVHDVSTSGRSFKNNTSYYMQVIKILFSYRSKSIEFEIDGQKVIGRFILIAIHNGTTFGGGFKLNPDGDISDGFLNICTVNRMPGWKRLINLGKLKYGTHGKLQEVMFYKGECLKIRRCNRAFHAHIDGEYLGTPPFEVKIIPKAISLRVAR